MHLKLTIGVPGVMLKELMRLTGGRTRREAVVTAIAEFNRSKRSAQLRRYIGTCRDFISLEESMRLLAFARTSPDPVEKER